MQKIFPNIKLYNTQICDFINICKENLEFELVNFFISQVIYLYLHIFTFIN